MNTDNLRTVTGLIAVITGIGAVIGLAIVTVSFLGSGNQEALVAITSSAFGIVSAVVTAYLGIKASANQAAASQEEAGEKTEKATNAQTRAEITQEDHDALVAAVESELPEAQANAVKAAALSRKRKPGPANPA